MTHRGAVSIRVLVIDDQRTMRDIIRHLLGQVGIHDVEEAENGEEAVDLICRPGFVQPDIIICDLHMKKMDGMEFCNKMRLDKNILQPGIPIIILTGNHDTFMHEVTQQIGATTVLLKPVSADALKEQIEAAVGFSI